MFPFNPTTFMKRLVIPTCAALAAIVLSSCAEVDSQTRERERASRFGYGATDTSTTTTTSNMTTTQVGPSVTTVPDVTPDTTSVSTTTDTTAVIDPATTVKKDYPYGTPVSGKPGFVTSPHAPYSGYVDVRGFPPGTEVKDPYTGKIFLVP